MTVVAEEDWTTMVTTSPVRMRLKVFDVMAARRSRILSPATFCKASLSIFIP